jgi:hypothetical protein
MGVNKIQICGLSKYEGIKVLVGGCALLVRGDKHYFLHFGSAEGIGH